MAGASRLGGPARVRPGAYRQRGRRAGTAAGAAGRHLFLGRRRLEYHKDPAKTRKAYNARGWATYGDIGYLDADGYLYLTDRLSNMIVSGGVNIYPQEAENLLCTHPAVADVAVIGVPDAEFGEAVKAVVQLREPSDAGPALAQALIDYCRARLSPIKCPKSVDFSADMPRTETGKLLKRLVKQRYWPAGRASPDDKQGTRMNPKRTLFAPEHELYRDMVARFIAERITPHHEQWEHEGMVPRELWRQAGQAGLLLPSTPESYGGGGAISCTRWPWWRRSPARWPPA